jgi:hypothetical protein
MEMTMKQHYASHAGYQLAVAYQTELRAARAVDRLARQAGAAPRAGGGLGGRLQRILLHARTAIALVISVPMRSTLNASDAAAQRTPGYTTTASRLASQADAP